MPSSLAEGAVVFMTAPFLFRAASIARVMRATVRPARERAKAHSQMRMTAQPDARKARVTARSRSAFRASFVTQKSKRLFGVRACRGHPCQKHPSTKMATRSALKIKSGLPGSGAPRRQPVTPAARMSAIILSSVEALPLPRTRDILSDRSAAVSVSATVTFSADTFCSAPRCRRGFAPQCVC
jgi:hypothetical protein